MNWLEFTKDCNKDYIDFAHKLNTLDTSDKSTNKLKGDISEEYFKRFLKWWPGIQEVVAVYNTNSSEAKSLVLKYPELNKLSVGTSNSPVVDLVIEHTNGYSLASAKWYASGLGFETLAGIFGINRRQYPNLKQKYLITNAPATSKVVEQVFSVKGTTDVIKILEEDFHVEPFEFQDLMKEVPTYKVYERWKFRNKREQLGFIKMVRKIRKELRAYGQYPPGWGKTYLLYRLDLYFWKRFGGITIIASDGANNIRQNWQVFTKEDRARGIQRPNLIICKGADDDELTNISGTVVGTNPAPIYKWLKDPANANGRIFIFYGNTLALESATQTHIKHNPDFKYTFAGLDEAGRSCQPEGSGWSHLVHDHRIPIMFRAPVDATPREGKKRGFDNKALYGECGDHVSQSESESVGSTVGFYLTALGFGKNKSLIKGFHERKYMKGKPYTVEDKVMAVALWRLYANNPTMRNTLGFGQTIERDKHFAQALEDSRKELMQKYSAKKYQDLANVEIYVADTHTKTSSQIIHELKDEKNGLYKRSKRSIVLTSRLLYRGYSNVEIDNIMFLDNFKSISYIVQALGRGLRVDPNNPDKLCQIIVPADLDQPQPWENIISLCNYIKKWDSRPVESILNLNNKPRGKAKRKPGAGGVQLTVNGSVVHSATILKSLKTYISTHTEWEAWSVWVGIANEFFLKLESEKHLLRSHSKTIGVIRKRIFDAIMTNNNYREIINEAYPKGKETKEIWFWRIMKIGSFGVKYLDCYKEFLSQWSDIIEDNENRLAKIHLEWFNDTQEARRKWALAAQKSVGWKYDEYKEDLVKITLKYKDLLKDYYPQRNDKSWIDIGRDIAFGGQSRFDSLSGLRLYKEYFEEEIKKTDEYIEEQRRLLVERVTKFALEYHKKTFTPLHKLKKYVQSQLDDVPDKRWNNWVWKQQFENKYTDEWFQYLEHPALDPKIPSCTKCKKASATSFKLKDGSRKYSEYCWTCTSKIRKEEKCEA